MGSLPTHSKPSKYISIRYLTATISVTLVVLLGVTEMNASADLPKGAIAYKSGYYATILREFRPLAEQGNSDAQFLLGWDEQQRTRCSAGL